MPRVERHGAAGGEGCARSTPTRLAIELAPPCTSRQSVRDVAPSRCGPSSRQRRLGGNSQQTLDTSDRSAGSTRPETLSRQALGYGAQQRRVPALCKLKPDCPVFP